MKSLFTTVVLLCFASLTRGSDSKFTSENLVGLWTYGGLGRHGVVLRRADGTFLEKFAFDESAQSMETFQISGHWRVKGGFYLSRAERISPWPTSKFTSDGKWAGLSISHIGGGRFKYTSSDNVDVEEHEVGAVSDETFQRTPIPPFQSSVPIDKGTQKALPVTR